MPSRTRRSPAPAPVSERDLPETGAGRDAAWLQAQYDHRARVPGAQALMARWTQASVLSRSRMTCELDLRYGEAEAMTLDVFPARRSGAPVLIFIHGGWWRSKDKSDMSFVAPAFVQAGAMVVVPNYTLAPAASIADIALQLTQAVAWTYRHARRYGGDPMQIAVAGHSAGGHLAAMLACCDWTLVGDDLPPELVTGALGVSGVYDLAPIRDVPFLRDDLRLQPADVARLSPVAFAPPPVPMLSLVGADESAAQIAQQRALKAAWGPALTVAEELPGRDHFTVMHDLVERGTVAHGCALGLLGLRPQVD